jgi:hypothetical protein
MTSVPAMTAAETDVKNLFVFIVSSILFIGERMERLPVPAVGLQMTHAQMVSPKNPGNLVFSGNGKFPVLPAMRNPKR